MKKYGLIMAGGGGTRFWPLSRQKTPKQLLNLTGNELMVNEAIDRLSYSVDNNDIFIVTNISQLSSMLKATEGRITPNHILTEPSSRNTAACIGYAALEIIKKYGDGIMIITPSDSYIEDTYAFTRTISEAVYAAENTNKLVTIGINPTFPSIGYGYIKFDKVQSSLVKRVVEFHEKPDEVLAKKYLETESYVWNSGMFIWKVSTILSKYKELIPDIYADLTKIGDSIGEKIKNDILAEIYSNIRKISVDYAIMEPAALKGDVLLVTGDFVWNDVGSWDKLGILNDLDENGNVAFGDTIAINTTNTILYSSNKLISVVGVDNLVVVETADAIMVCNKDKAQDVKLIVEELSKSGRKELI